jgi:hypothetical protein
VIDTIFGDAFSGTRFAIPAVDTGTSVPLPQDAPNQRYAPLIALLSRQLLERRSVRNDVRSSSTNYMWVEGEEAFVHIIMDSLNQTLRSLNGFEARPWGVGARPNRDFNGIGNVYDEPIGSVPDGHLPSLNANVRMGRCGPIAVDSSVHFGVSGTVFDDGEGNPVFTDHTMDQFELYRTYRVKPAPRLFRATTSCLQSNSDRDDSLNAGEIAGIALGCAAFLGVVAVVTVAGIKKRTSANESLKQKLTEE